MIEPTRQPEELDYHYRTHFKADFLRIPGVNYYCQSVVIPSISVSPLEISSPLLGTPLYEPGTSAIHSDLVLSFLVDRDLKNYRELHNWFTSLGPNVDYSRVGLMNRAVVDYCSVHLLSPKFQFTTTIRFTGVYPKSVPALPMAHNKSDAEPVVLRASFGFTYFEIEE